jgi:hypothetical protein
MFGYKRSYSSKGRRYYSFGRPYSKYGRRGTVGRAAAGAAAAKRSDKTETYSCTVNGVMNMGLAAHYNLSTVTKIAPYAGGVRGEGTVDDERNLVHGGAVNDRGFRMKCACYDEIKLDSMKVTITPAQLFQHQAVTMTICTFWDRKASPKECGFVGGGDWMANGSVPTALEIFNNEGTIKSVITNNNIFGFKRYCRASSIIEKGGYHDSSILYNPTAEQSPTTWMYLDAWVRNPMAFSPCLYTMIYCPASFAQAQLLSFSYKVEYTFTFRNPKSDLDYFLLIESPGYVNPGDEGDGAGGDLNGNNRSAKRGVSGSLLADMQKMYTTSTIKTMDLPEATKTIDSLFDKKEEAKKEESKVFDVEDDPGTA